MRCDICHERILFNQDDWLYREQPIDRETTLVVYAAHVVCDRGGRPDNPAPDADAVRTYWLKLMGQV